MTRFIESFATQHVLPPWISRNVATWMFVLRLGDSHGVQRYVDDYFNGAGSANDGDLPPSPYVYTPLPVGEPYALLVVADHPGAASLGKDGRERNRLSYRIVHTALPVHRHRRSPDGGSEDPQIVWVRPTTWCNSSTFVFSAREIWGADVEFQQIDRDPNVEAPALHLDTSYIGVDPFAPSSFNELLAALHVRAGPSIPADDAGSHIDDLQLRSLIRGLVADNQQPPPAAFAEAVGCIDIDALKQFRAAEDMRLAIFRGLVASRQWHSQPRNLAIHDLAGVEVDFMRSATFEDLHTGFGLMASGRGVPPEHPPTRPPPPAVPGAPPTEIRWDLARGPARVAFCLSFTADYYFEVLRTLHVYRPQA